MTPPRPTLTGHAVAARPLAGLVVIATIVAACIGGASDGAATSSPANISSEPPPATAPSTPTMQPSPSASEAPTESPVASAQPTAEPTSSLPPEEAVLACTGTDDNRAFFAEAAENLDWPVYCATLPARWSVDTGRYSGRGLGQLEISYKGPAGATLSLQQGGFCETSDGCVPAGTDSGAASFGDQTGTLVTLDDGGFAIVVQRAAAPSWLAVVSGVDEPTFRSLAEAFVRLD